MNHPTFEEVWPTVNPIQGWFSINESRQLYDLACRLEGLVVEVGSYCGRSTTLLAASGRVIAIDPFDGILRGADWVPRIDPWPSFEKNALGSPWGRNITVIKGYDQDMFPTWDRGKVGLLFLDHEHTEEAVKRSLLGWKPHMAPGARVALHDYGHRDYPGVKTGVEVAGLSVEVVHESLAVGFWPRK